MKTLTTLLVYSLMLMAVTNCKSDDDTPTNPIDQLPPPTQTGENTFGCLINGDPLFITNSNKITAIYQGGFVQFGGEGVYIVALDPFTTNIPYDFLDIGEGTARARYTKEIQESTFCYYEYGNTYEGFIKFSKIDKTNYIISGTFEFSTKKDGCPDIKITNGRFDMKYIP
ncbi:hypothetical protein [Mariniflexile sp.]|uniref:hypothetical protein n=1 Tax=Mariniflexile sp. TaxID=1979402 RepID=UPI0040472EBB